MTMQFWRKKWTVFHQIFAAFLGSILLVGAALMATVWTLETIHTGSTEIRTDHLPVASLSLSLAERVGSLSAMTQMVVAAPTASEREIVYEAIIDRTAEIRRKIEQLKKLGANERLLETLQQSAIAFTEQTHQLNRAVQDRVMISVEKKRLMARVIAQLDQLKRREKLHALQQVEFLGILLQLLSSSTLVEHKVKSAQTQQAYSSLRSELWLQPLLSSGVLAIREQELKKQNAIYGQAIELKRRADHQIALANNLYQNTLASVDRVIEKADQRIQQSLPFTVAFVLLVIIGIVTFWVFIQRRIVVPLSRLHFRVSNFQKGDPIDFSVDGPEEISVIADALQSVTRQSAEREVEAQQANEAKGLFLANMSHEIRTPMNAVIGLTHLALERESSARQRDYLTKIEGASQALLQIINDILDHSKIEAGQLDMEQIPYDLRAELEKIEDVIALHAQQKPLDSRFDIAPDLPQWVMGDPNRLRQVLLNLLNNAMKFTQRGSVSLTVRGKVSGQLLTLHFSVCDTGIGMDAEQLTRLFDPFTQAERSTARKYGGTGLGLAISKQLVELMGGKIEVESNPGEGSCFRFSIPSEVATESTDALELQPNLSGVRILLVEDNPLNQQVASEILQNVDAEVVVANNGVEALQLIAEDGQFALVLMDLQMPEMDGFEATERIRALPQHKTLPIIAMTANAMSRDRERANAVGIDDFLFKPIDVDLFYRLIGQYMKREIEMTSIQPVTEQQSSWPTRLPGLSIEEGVKRVAGNRILYCRLLGDFVRDGGAMVESIARSVSSRERVELSQLAHALRGIAANIGADEIARLATELESVSESGERCGDRYIEPLMEQLQSVEEAYRTLSTLPMEEEQKEESEHLRYSPVALKRVLEELDQLLEGNSMDAEMLFVRISSQLEAEADQEIAQRIKEDIELFQFKEARAQLHRLSVWKSLNEVEN